MNLIFVAGIPRSGTTMVQNILDSHHEIFGGPEFDRIPNIVDLRRKLQDSILQDRIGVYANAHKVDALIASLIENLLQNEQTDGVTYISEKTPWNILVFKDLIEIFPNAKFIHVLRSPIHVLNSMVQVANRSRSKGLPVPDYCVNPYIAVHYIFHAYRLAEELEKVHDGKFLTLKYEDLSNDLEIGSKEMCAFLDLDWDENMLLFNEMPHLSERTMTKDGKWYTAEQFKQNVNQKKVDLSTLPPKWKAVLYSVLCDDGYLKSKGYDLSEFKSSVGIVKKRICRSVFYKKYYHWKTPIRLLD